MAIFLFGDVLKTIPRHVNIQMLLVLLTYGDTTFAWTGKYYHLEMPYATRNHFDMMHQPICHSRSSKGFLMELIFLRPFISSYFPDIFFLLEKKSTLVTCSLSANSCTCENIAFIHALD